MPDFGIVTTVENAAAVKAAGWSFVEVTVGDLLQGQVPDEQWNGLERSRRSVLPIPAANALVPAALKVTGPAADPVLLRRFMTTVLDRAQRIGIKTVVFGSGAARMVPDGFDREQARQQILDFLRFSADLAGACGILLVAEPLNRGECNIINSVDEAMEYVKELNHPHFQCLVDSFHLWLENEPLDGLARAMPSIRHVHVSDRQDRSPPGESGQDNYRPFFHVLKQAGYDGPIAMESFGFCDFEVQGRACSSFFGGNGTRHEVARCLYRSRNRNEPRTENRKS